MGTKSYSFRIHLVRSALDTLAIDDNQIDLVREKNGPTVRLHSLSENASIRESDTWVLMSDGWISDIDARKAGEKYFDAFMLSLARIRIGVDFGFRHLRSVITEEGLRWLEQKARQRMIAEMAGVNVYETEPTPRFAKSEVDVLRTVPREKLERVFAYALEKSIIITNRKRLALELFNSSFFQKTVDTRFLMLILAVESLIEPSIRSDMAIEHVNTLVAETRSSNMLKESEKSSMLGVLEWLKRESIGQAGRKLATSQLGNRLYMNMPPGSFFTRCYTLRSRMVHGDLPFPDVKEINAISGTLEVFVSHLVSGQLLEIDLGE